MSAATADAVSAREVTAGELPAIELSNGLVAATIAPARGADVLELRDVERDVQVLWKSPAWGRDSARRPSAEHGAGATFFDHYPGGMQEVLPNGGPSCTYEGAELGFHGEACKVPWTAAVREREDRTELRCTTRLARLPFELEKTFSLGPGDRALRIDVAIRNAGHRDLHYMWGFHPAFGAPLLGASTRLHCPAGHVVTDAEPFGAAGQTLAPGTDAPWPGDGLDRLAPPSRRGADLWYLGGLDAGWYALENEERDVIAAMSWDHEVFPWVWVWQERHDDAGHPWFGEHHVVAVEPWTSQPAGGLPHAIENGTAPLLAAGGRRATTLTIGVGARDGRRGRLAGVEPDGTLRFTEDEA